MKRFLTWAWLLVVAGCAGTFPSHMPKSQLAHPKSQLAHAGKPASSEAGRAAVGANEPAAELAQPKPKPTVTSTAAVRSAADSQPVDRQRRQERPAQLGEAIQPCRLCVLLENQKRSSQPVQAAAPAGKAAEDHSASLASRHKVSARPHQVLAEPSREDDAGPVLQGESQTPPEAEIREPDAEPAPETAAESPDQAVHDAVEEAPSEPPQKPAAEMVWNPHDASDAEVEEASADESAGVDAPHGGRHGHAPDYAWLQGTLEYRVRTREWRIRYAGLSEQDRFGGCLRLGGIDSQEAWKEGDWVRVEGRVLPSTGRGSSPPAYEVDRVIRLSPQGSVRNRRRRTCCAAVCVAHEDNPLVEVAMGRPCRTCGAEAKVGSPR